MADVELKQAFADLQKKMIETRAQMNVANAQIAQFENEKARSKAAFAEISTLAEDTKMYQSCGQMFISRSREEIENYLENVQTAADQKVKDLEAKKIYLEKSVKESEENLREMVSQRRK